MAYELFLYENLSTGFSYGDLDVENVDITTVYSVASISDISERTDNLTKQITLKGTKKNNILLGNLFNISRHTDLTIENKINVNYNSARTVDAILYENSKEILTGSFRVVNVEVDAEGNVQYQAIIASPYIEFGQALGEKKLEDLDMSDLKHHYSISVMENSAEICTERHNGTTFENVAFEMGKGYFYPYGDHGVNFKSETHNSNRHNPYVHIENMRPAVFVREYFDRIFAQSELEDFTYEVKGEPSVVDAFNRLHIPNNVERMIAKNNEKNFRLQKTDTLTATSATAAGNNNYFIGWTKMEIPLNLQSGLSLTTSENLLNYYGNYMGLTKAVMRVERTFTCDGYLRAKFSTLQNLQNATIKWRVELCQRDHVPSNATEFNHGHLWNVISSSTITLSPLQTLTNQTIQFDIGETTFEANKQVMVRIISEDGTYYPLLVPYAVNFTLTELELSLPKNQISGLITMDIMEGDVVTPQPPVEVRQIEFIKNIMYLFNFYAYTEKHNPKHIIFQTHDEFYALCDPAIMHTTAVDWTFKVDWTRKMSSPSNLSLPKKYLFSFKQDEDYFSKMHKDLRGTGYGDLTFNDAYGVTDTKKLELIFSPTPAVEYEGRRRIHHCLHKYDSGKPKAYKPNIRVLFYNGLKNCQAFTLAKDKQTNTGWDIQILKQNITRYACATEFLYGAGLDNMTPIQALYFGQPIFINVGITTPYENLPNIFSQRYMNLVSNLTDENMRIVECYVFLNESDVPVDLRTPVFIDFGGSRGNAYFKVLKVEYYGNDQPSLVQLQKITF